MRKYSISSSGSFSGGFSSSSSSKVVFSDVELPNAARQGDITTVEAILAKGKCNVNYRDSDGCTALLRAAITGNVTLVQLLLNYGARGTLRTLPDLKPSIDLNLADNEGDTPVYMAAAMGHKEVLEALLQQPGINPDIESSIQKGGSTALTNAAQLGQYESVSVLVNHPGVNINHTEKNGFTALMIAADRGYDDIAELLLKNSADWEVKSNDGATAKSLAEKDGHRDILVLLNAKKKGELWYRWAERKRSNLRVYKATIEGDTQIVEELCGTSWQILLDGTLELTAATAKKLGNLKVVDACRRAMAKKNEQCNKCEGDTKQEGEIMLEAMKISIPVPSKVRVVHECIADEEDELTIRVGDILKITAKDASPGWLIGINDQGQQGLVPETHVELISILVRRQSFQTQPSKSEIRQRDRLPSLCGSLSEEQTGGPPQDKLFGETFVYTCRLGDVEQVELILNKEQVDINYRDQIYGATGLYVAAYHGHTAVVEFLLNQNGTNPNIKRKTGGTALYAAASYGYTDVVKLLLDHGNTKPNIQRYGGATALYIASDLGHADVVQCLLQHDQIDPNIRRASGDTALTIAAHRGHLEIVKMLLEHDKTKVNSITNVKETALTLAIDGEHKDVAKAIIGQASTDVDHQNQSGLSGLMYAVMTGSADLAEMLLEQGAVHDLRTYNGRSALKLAEKHRQQEVIDVLKSQAEYHCADIWREELDIGVGVPPFTCRLDRGLMSDFYFTVSGQIHPSTERFHVNLQTADRPDANIPLHINPRIDTKEAVFNSKENGSWGPESIQSLSSLGAGNKFKISVVCTEEDFKISLNDKFWCSFKHRFQIEKINYVSVHGGVKVSGITYGHGSHSRKMSTVNKLNNEMNNNSTVSEIEGVNKMGMMAMFTVPLNIGVSVPCAEVKEDESTDL